jgi:pimeloyl-ACP methyl ester carboxylesterase
MAEAHSIQLADGRALDFWDTGGNDFAIVWHGGSPQTGAPLLPLLGFAESLGIRLITYARPGYGGSTALADRDVASAASDVEQLADAVGLNRFAVMGHSGGGPHALACAALLPERVSAVATFAGVAPFDADIDWFGGMASDGESLRAAALGRDARVRYEETAEFDAASFNDRDYAELDGDWGDMGRDANEAGALGPSGLIADDLSFAKPWGFDVRDVTAPALVVQGGDDHVIPVAHGEWLARNLPESELWLRPRDGHIAILPEVPLAMRWLQQAAQAGSR